MKRFSPLIVFCLLSWISPAQHLPCGTRIFRSQAEVLRDFNPDTKNFRLATTLSRVAISAHLIKRDDGSGGLTLAQLDDAVGVLNSYYSNAGLEFFLAVVDEIHSSQYYTFNTADETALSIVYDIPKTLNIYFTETVTDDESGSLCGYAYFPGGPDRVFMANSCATNGTTLPHEIGHFFALFHTHGNSNSELTDELVNGSNCETTGDELCDTPADPQLSYGNVNSNCAYIGREVDANNDLFVPDPRNIMSYSRKECRDVFTPGQYSRVNQAYAGYRAYLRNRKVVADFGSNWTEPCVSNVVTFHDLSLNAKKWQWEFEGGIPSSATSQHPQIQYQSAGIYDVKLMIEDASGEMDTLILANYIHVIPGQETKLITSQEDFESAEIGFSVANPDELFAYKQTDLAAFNGRHSMTIDFYNYSNVGAEDFLINPFIDNTFSHEYELNFSYAYTYFDAEHFDKLEVVYRPACQLEWTTIWAGDGADLATANPIEEMFVPKESDWKSMKLNFTIPEEAGEFEIAFKATNGFGNNLYIDQVALSPIIEVETKGYSCPGLADGSINVLTTGTRDFRFSIDGESFVESASFENLEAGDYTVTIKDELGRTFSKTVKVSGSQLQLSTIDITCNGDENGSVNFAVTGSADNYDFYINDELVEKGSASGLAAGIYVLKVVNEEKGCVVEQSFEITASEILTADFNISNAECFGASGIVEVQAIGGVPPYNYQLDDGKIDSNKTLSGEAGAHVIHIYDSKGCETQYSLEINEPDSLYLTFTKQGFLCEKNPSGSLSIEVFGGVGDHQLFLNGEPLNSFFIELSDIGEYVFKIVDAAGCEVEKDIPLAYQYDTPEKPVINLVEGKLKVADTAAKITWYKNGEVVVGAFDNTLEYAPGIYQVGLSYGVGTCEVLSEEFVILSVDDPLLAKIRVDPNPIMDRFEVQIPQQLRSGFQRLSVYDLSGHLVLISSTRFIDQHWPPGVYLIHVEGDQYSRMLKVIVN